MANSRQRYTFNRLSSLTELFSSICRLMQLCTRWLPVIDNFSISWSIQWLINPNVFNNLILQKITKLKLERKYCFPCYKNNLQFWYYQWAEYRNSCENRQSSHRLSDFLAICSLILGSLNMLSLLCRIMVMLMETVPLIKPIIIFGSLYGAPCINFCAYVSSLLSTQFLHLDQRFSVKQIGKK